MKTNEEFMKEELERLYALVKEQRTTMNSMADSLKLCIKTLQTLSLDKWARYQPMKYGDSTVGELVDEVLLDLDSVIKGA